MREQIKALIKHTPLYHAAREFRSGVTAAHRRANWIAAGCPAPPPDVVKRETLLEYANRYELRTLIETGTFMGDTIQAMKRHFERLYSIELSEDLAAQAQRRFAQDRHITILQGDSGQLLGPLASSLTSPALFWLDAHYSDGITARAAIDTPIMQELVHVLKPGAPKHVILIDDARDFGRDPSYPTIDEVVQCVLMLAADYEVTVAHDSMRIVPKA